MKNTVLLLMIITFLSSCANINQNNDTNIIDKGNSNSVEEILLNNESDTLLEDINVKNENNVIDVNKLVETELEQNKEELSNEDKMIEPIIEAVSKKLVSTNNIKSDICKSEESVGSLKNSLFPAPKIVDYKLDLGTGECPASSNYSKIYFEDNYNLAAGKTSSGEFTINGFIITDVEKIEIIWDGDMVSYFLNKYVPGKKEFSYNISTKFSNIKIGKNKYLIRGYSKNGIYEKFFTLNYYDLLTEVILEKKNFIFDREVGDDNFNIGYIKNDNTYSLGLDYGKYKLALDNSNIIFYNDLDKDKSYIKINNGKENILKDYYFLTDLFSNNQLVEYENGDLLFSASGHEAPKNYVYYSYKFNKFIKIFDLIEEYIGNTNFYTDLEINDGILIIKSMKTPWVSEINNFELKMNLDTLKITKQ